MERQLVTGALGGSSAGRGLDPSHQEDRFNEIASQRFDRQ